MGCRHVIDRVPPKPYVLALVVPPVGVPLQRTSFVELVGESLESRGPSLSQAARANIHVMSYTSMVSTVCILMTKKMQRTFGLCQLATSLKKGCGSETNNILTMLISETYYIGTLTSQRASRGLLNYLRSGARVTRVLCSVLARLKPFRRRVRGDAFLRHSSSSCLPSA